MSLRATRRLPRPANKVPAARMTPALLASPVSTLPGNIAPGGVVSLACAYSVGTFEEACS